jgi:hypothetical protein
MSLLYRLILISIESYNNSDSTPESDYKSSQSSISSSDCDNKESTENFESELSKTIYNEFNNVL